MAEHMTAGSGQIQPILPSPERLKMRYDAALDTLFISTQPPQPAVSVDINGEIWVRFVPETAEVVGVEIEDFQASFLRDHPEIAAAWHDPQGPRLTALWPLLRPESFSPHLLPVAARWRGGP